MPHVRHRLLPSIEYHRAIGIEHFSVSVLNQDNVELEQPRELAQLETLGVVSIVFDGPTTPSALSLWTLSLELQDYVAIDSTHRTITRLLEDACRNRPVFPGKVYTFSLVAHYNPLIPQ